MNDRKYESPKQKRASLKRFTPRKDDSPSRQLGFELERALDQLRIHDYEHRKLHAYNRRSYHEELDAKDLALARAHMAALEAASAKHEAVRQEAEAVLQRHLKEQEERRLRELEEERLRQEREAREQAEREAKAKEEAERRIRAENERKDAEARKVAEEKAKVQAAEAERTKRKEAEAAAAEAAIRKENEEKAVTEKNRLTREAAIKAASESEAAEKLRLQQSVAAASRASVKKPAKPGIYSASPEAELYHNEYLTLHQKLKDFRSNFWKQTRSNKQLKSVIGDVNRVVRTSVGQLTDDKEGNKQATNRVKTAILRALKEIPSPEVPVSDYLPPHLSLNDNSANKVPSLVIYLLSLLSKAIINGFAGECAVNTKLAEAIGTLTAQIFALPELQFTRSHLTQTASTPASATTNAGNNQSLIPILLAKFHKVAPILFGISGDEKTVEGRQRLGWRKEPSDDNSDTRVFTTEQRHHDRMTGLGAGFASMALRNFGKTRLHNPFPPSNFWFAISSMVDTPVEDVQTSHLLLMKSMLENNGIDRFILFYGHVGVAVLREALVNWPARLPDRIKSKSACQSLILMVEALGKEKHFHLT